MRIPINMGVKGRVTATLTNTETGEKQEVKGNNLILDDYADWVFTRGIGILNTTAFNRCHIGTGDSPPQPSDKGLQGSSLAVSSSPVIVQSVVPTNKIDFQYIREHKNMFASDCDGIAISEDGLLYVGSDGVNRPGISVYEINTNTWDLLPIETDAFSEIEDLSCDLIRVEGNYLFIRCPSPVYGKLYFKSSLTEYVDTNATFVGAVASASISPDGKYFAYVTGGNCYLYRLSGLTLSPISLEGIPAEFENNIKQVALSDTNSMALIGGRMGDHYEYNDLLYFEIVADSATWVRTLDLGGRPPSRHQLKYDKSGVWDASCSWFINPDVWKDYCYEVNADATNRTRISESTREDASFVSLARLSSRIRSLVFLFGGRRILERVPSGGTSTFDTSLSGLLAGAGVKRSSIAIYQQEGAIFNLVGDSIIIHKVKDKDRVSIQSFEAQWTFPAGVGTGVVNEVVLQANSGTGSNGNNKYVARIVLPEPLEKTDLHQLDISWRIEIENPGVWEGVIPGGSRDGSDLSWRITISDKQHQTLWGSTGYNTTASWFGVSGTPTVRIGDDNSPTNLLYHDNEVYGKQIDYISSSNIAIALPYVPGSLERTFRLFLDVDQGIGSIGEMTLGPNLCRVTFDPPLDKPPEETDPHRVYLDFTFGWQRGESDA